MKAIISFSILLVSILSYSQSGRGYISFAKRGSGDFGGSFNLKGDFNKKVIYSEDSNYTAIILSNCADFLDNSIDSLEQGTSFDNCLMKNRFALMLVFRCEDKLSDKGYINLSKSYKSIQRDFKLIYKSLDGDIIRKDLIVKNGSIRFKEHKSQDFVNIRCTLMNQNFYDVSLLTDVAVVEP